MNPSTYIPIIFLWIIKFVMLRKRKKALVIRKILKKRKTGDNTEMNELAKRFIDKECLINSLDHQYEGVIKEIADGAILVEKAGMLEAISLDYIVRIREFPKNKKGKKKSVVLD